MFERFTDEARSVLRLAQEEARLLRHNFIGTEHILLGLIHESEGTGAKALENLGITLADVRDEVEETIGRGGTDPSGPPPFTPRAKKVLELSFREALQLGHRHIGTEHLLLGLVREGEGVAATVLVSLGAGLPRVRREVLRLMQVSADEEGGEAPELVGSESFPVGARRRRQSAPHCPECGAGLDEVARFRTILVPADPADTGLEPRLVDVVYCRRCGTTLLVDNSRRVDE